MDLARMLEKCRRDQWSVDELDWSRPPRSMSPAEEMAVVQCFTDMALIERLAGALFREQQRRVVDPVLKKIFATFVVDEARHAVAAERLAAYYDVHHYRTYRPSKNLERFTPHFLNLVANVSDEIANVYITVGELMLDIALLRSINDYVADPMSAQAMHLINRDESRHIAIDYRMVEYYASQAYAAKVRAEPPKSMRQHAKTWRTVMSVVFYAKPFFYDVFFEPMERLDPRGRRLREVFRRIELLGAKPGVTDRPFPKFLFGLKRLYNHPVGGALFGRVASRLVGVDRSFMAQLATDEDLARTRTMTFDELAEEALKEKHVN